MNRLGIIKAVAKTLETEGEASLAVRAIFDVITKALRNGEKVVISNFGTFRVKERRSRQARNPKTGDSVAVPPRRGIRFKASKIILGE